MALGALPRRACGAVSCAALSDRYARVAPLRRPHDPARVAHDGGTSNYPLGAPVSPPLEGCGTASPERPDPAPQGAPQGPAEPHVAEGASAFEPALRRRHTGTAGSASAGVNRSGCSRSPVMVRASARAWARPAASSSPSCATVCCTTLPPTRYRADQPPVAVDLAVLPPRRMAQVHCPVYAPGRARKSMNLVGTTRAVPVPGVPRLRLTPRRGPQPGVAPLELWKLG